MTTPISHLRVVWKNNKEFKSEAIEIGKTTFVVTGYYSAREESSPPDFEIEHIYHVVPDGRGGSIPIEVDDLIDDIETVTFKKEANNSLIDYFRQKIIDRYV